jgi:hypothetical protein
VEEGEEEVDREVEGVVEVEVSEAEEEEVEEEVVDLIIEVVVVVVEGVGEGSEEVVGDGTDSLNWPLVLNADSRLIMSPILGINKLNAIACAEDFYLPALARTTATMHLLVAHEL